jgi:hypothetical protein
MVSRSTIEARESPIMSDETWETQEIPVVAPGMLVVDAYDAS